MTAQEINTFSPLVGSIALGALAILMFQRKLHNELPHFFRYVCFVAISSVIVFALCDTPYHDPAYWVSSFVYSGLCFLVFYEVFVRLLKPYAAVIDLARMLFKWLGAFLLLVAVMGALASGGNAKVRLEAALSLIDRSLMLMQCGILMLLVVFEKRLKISWRSYSASITIGLGVSAAVGLIVSYLASAVSLYSGTLLYLAQNVVFLTFVGYWAVMLQQRESQRKNVLESPSRLVFQRWNEVLSSTPLVAQGNQFAMAEVDSFIPGVEKTVERIMARKMSVN
jgi:hypothetical protein